MTLLSIADLDKNKDSLTEYLNLISGLGSTYDSFIANDTGSYKYEIDIHGDGSRAAGIHASEVSGCLRKLVYSIMDTERRPDPTTTDTNMKMRFKLGHSVHAMLQNDWGRIAAQSKGTIEYSPEVRINPDVSKLAKEWDIHSSCDGVFNLTHPNSQQLKIRIGHEIKTASDGEFGKLKSPKPFHIEQAHVYMACLDLPLMWFTYYNKSNSNYTPPCAPWVIRFNKSLWEKLELRFVKAIHMAESKALPEREEGMECRWCPVSYTCQPNILKSKSPQMFTQIITPGMRRR